MKKKRDYKTVQIGFRDKYAYDSFHKKAVRYCGCDSRLADCMYLRECIKANEKKKRASSKKKAQEFVKAQVEIANILQQTDDEKIQSLMMELSKEVIDIWAC